MIQKLPAGLIDDNAEFFVTPDMQPKCLISGSAVAFEDFGSDLLAALSVSLYSHHSKKVAIYQKMTGSTDEMVVLKQFTFCCYGGFDCKADLFNGALKETEYWQCPNRAVCKFDGKGCDRLRTDSGQHLTKREIEYIQQTSTGKLDKEIAGDLRLSLYTITTHSKNVRKKLGLLRKADITRFAHQKNLI
jgi:DNA-binding CsgD family transcriptional regulator